METHQRTAPQSEARARLSLLESLREAASERSIDEQLTWDSFPDEMSEHVTKEQQEREVRRRLSNAEPNLVARYFRRCQNKHWAAKRDAAETPATINGLTPT